LKITKLLLINNYETKLFTEYQPNIRCEGWSWPIAQRASDSRAPNSRQLIAVVIRPVRAACKQQFCIKLIFD
jgi:hypothetical protein